MNRFSEYLRTSLLFYGVIFFSKLIPIHIVVPALIFGFLFSLIFNNITLVGLTLLIALLINFVDISLQRLVLKNGIYASKPLLLSPNLSTNSSTFKTRIIDLDGSVVKQETLLKRYNPDIVSLQEWGLKIRISSSFSTFSQFESELNRRLKVTLDESPFITFIGSNDFDHVTLTLLRRLSTPFNLLFFDKHADWNPFFLTDMMCGSWLYHALSATNMRMVFHVGGAERAFDATGDLFDAVECFGNGRGVQKYINEGRIVCLPATRKFAENPYINYENTVNEPMKVLGKVSEERLKSLLEKYKEQLKNLPLFIAIDKDVLNPQENIQSWDSGELSLEDVETIISTFTELCNYRVAGVSICGDYSKPIYNNSLRLSNILDKIALSHGIRVPVDLSSLSINEKTNERLVLLFKDRLFCKNTVKASSSS